MTTSNKTPSSAIIVGEGQISSHIPKLFSFLYDQYTFCDRTTQFNNLNLSNVSAAFLAVNDHSILEVFNKLHNQLNDQMKNQLKNQNHKPDQIQFYHLSGALSFSNIIGVHPLMTFAKDSKILNYEEIPLFTDSEIFYTENKKRCKNLKYISSDLKIKYHAMATLLGNFSQYYLQTIKDDFPQNLIFEDYKMLVQTSVAAVFEKNSRTKLTGPMDRKDEQTIIKHKKSLYGQDSKLLKVYSQMEDLFRQELFNYEN